MAIIVKPVTAKQEDPDKVMIALMINKQVHMTIKLYCVKTGITMKEFFEPYSQEFEKQLLAKAAEITEMERQAEVQRLKEIEEQKIAAEHPLEVPGQQLEEPITQ